MYDLEWTPTKWTRVQNGYTLEVWFDKSGDRIRWGCQRPEWHWRVGKRATTYQAGSCDTRDEAMAQAMQEALRINDTI